MSSNEGGEYFEEDEKTNVKIEKVYSKENSQNVGKNPYKICGVCGKNYKTQRNLRLHVQAEHLGIKFTCYQCNYQATTNGSLKAHIQSLHEKIKYSCHRCDYQATTKGGLKTHIQAIHEKIKYSCNQCDH